MHNTHRDEKATSLPIIYNGYTSAGDVHLNSSKKKAGLAPAR